MDSCPLSLVFTLQAFCPQWKCYRQCTDDALFSAFFLYMGACVLVYVSECECSVILSSCYQVQTETQCPDSR